MILDSFRLDGRVAVVTGGTKGIGRAVALALAEAGADIFVASRTPDPEIEQAVTALGRRYTHHAADLSRRKQTRGVIPAALETMGSVDILVNNAGVIHTAPAAEYPEEEWDVGLEIDLTAAFILSQAAHRIMAPRKRGKIVNVASVLAFQGGTWAVAYTVAKHGLAGLTRALSNEWAREGINVNAIAPSYFLTELTGPIHTDPDRARSIARRTPAGRWGVPDDAAGAVVFLASPASDFLHGVILPVDGGWLAW